MISVIIPTYNRDKTILKSINSVLNQTYSDIEVIVVDDGSTDNTKKTVNSIKDKRLKYIYQKNQGACVARNRGIEEARGEYIAFHDSDDEWKNNKLEVQIKFLNEKKADFVSCGMKRNTKSNLKNVSLDYEINLENLLKYNVMSTQTMLMKKEVCQKVKFDKSFKRLQDWDYVLQVYLANYKIEYLNKPLVETNDSDNSITYNVNIEYACNHLIEKYKKYYNQYKKSLAYVYMLIARNAKNENRKIAHKYLVKSFKKDPKIKTFIKIILNTINLWH